MTVGLRYVTVVAGLKLVQFARVRIIFVSCKIVVVLVQSVAS